MPLAGIFFKSYHVSEPILNPNEKNITKLGLFRLSHNPVIAVDILVKVVVVVVNVGPRNLILNFGQNRFHNI